MTIKHVTQMTPEEAFENGKLCAEKKLNRYANPYRNLDGYDTHWEQWNDGWQTALDEANFVHRSKHSTIT